MNIVCSSDANFVKHMATMLVSLVENNARHNIRIFILYIGELDGISKIETLLARHANVSLMSVDESLVPNRANHRGNNRTPWLRLLMGEVLPPEVDRVLYLDCDTIVRGDLADLWNTDLRGRTLGAVPDVVPDSIHNVHAEWLSELGFPPDAPYFNSGVLLVDLRRWRELGIGQRSLDFAFQHIDQCRRRDQDALNVIAQGDWLSLDPKWNFQSGEVCETYDEVIRFKRISWRMRDTIKVVHFTSHSKPWHYLNYHPMKREYLRYRQRTPWPLEHFDDRFPHFIIYRFLHQYVPSLLPVYLAARKIL